MISSCSSDSAMLDIIGRNPDTIGRIPAHMEVEMTHAETRSPWMTDPDSAEAVWFLATRMTVLATAETTDGALGLIEAVVPPGFSPPLHVHSREDEPMYVIEGRVSYQVGDRRFEAEAGSVVGRSQGNAPPSVVGGDVT